MDEIAIIKSLEDPFNEAFASRDAARLAGFYSEDGSSQAPFEDPVTGRAALLAMFEAVCADPGFSFRFEAKIIEVAASGEAAWSVGGFAMTYSDPSDGRLRVIDGAYQTIWKKQADGAWKVFYDTMTPGLARNG